MGSYKVYPFCVRLISLSTKSSSSATFTLLTLAWVPVDAQEKSQHGWGWGCVGHLSTHSPDLQKLAHSFLVLKNAVPLNSETKVVTQSLHCPQRGFLIITEWKIIAKLFFKPIIPTYPPSFTNPTNVKVLSMRFPTTFIFSALPDYQDGAEGQARGLRTL